jgi:hypothetical protein
MSAPRFIEEPDCVYFLWRQSYCKSYQWAAKLASAAAYCFPSSASQVTIDHQYGKRRQKRTLQERWSHSFAKCFRQSLIVFVAARAPWHHYISYFDFDGAMRVLWLPLLDQKRFLFSTMANFALNVR